MKFSNQILIGFNWIIEFYYGSTKFMEKIPTVRVQSAH